MDLSKTIITTERLKLAPVSDEYAGQIFKEFTAKVTTYMFPQPARKIEETLEFIRTSKKSLMENEELVVVITNLQTREFLGCCGIHLLNTDTPELGIWIKISAHGHAYGKEAVQVLKTGLIKT